MIGQLVRSWITIPLRGVTAREPDVAWDKVLVDAMIVRMVLRPQTLDTIVASNLHADILSARSGGSGADGCGSTRAHRFFVSAKKAV